MDPLRADHKGYPKRQSIYFHKIDFYIKNNYDLLNMINLVSFLAYETYDSPKEIHQ